nr:hypothetical protein [Tanacetum cinerariifolium]
LYLANLSRTMTTTVAQQVAIDNALAPLEKMTNQQMRDSTAYKTYLAYATGATSPKMRRKFKKPASPSKKRTLVTIEEEEPEPAKKVVPSKKPAAKRQYAGVRIRDTPGKSLKRSKRETNIHQAISSSEGADFESEGSYEPKGKSIDTHEGTGLKPRA